MRSPTLKYIGIFFLVVGIIFIFAVFYLTYADTMHWRDPWGGYIERNPQEAEVLFGMSLLFYCGGLAILSILHLPEVPSVMELPVWLRVHSIKRLKHVARVRTIANLVGGILLGIVILIVIGGYFAPDAYVSSGNCYKDGIFSVAYTTNDGGKYCFFHAITWAVPHLFTNPQGLPSEVLFAAIMLILACILTGGTLMWFITKSWFEHKLNAEIKMIEQQEPQNQLASDKTITESLPESEAKRRLSTGSVGTRMEICCPACNQLFGSMKEMLGHYNKEHEAIPGEG